MFIFKKQALVVLMAFALLFSSTTSVFAATGNGTQAQARNGHLEVMEASFFAPNKSLIAEQDSFSKEDGIQYNITLRIYDHNKKAWASAGEKVDIYLKDSAGKVLFTKTFYTNSAGYVYGHVLTSELPENFYLDIYIQARVIKLNGVASEVINSPTFNLDLTPIIPNSCDLQCFNGWVLIEEDNNELDEIEAPDVFNMVQDVEWSTIQEVGSPEEINWDEIPIEVNPDALVEEPTGEVQILGIVARIVIVGGAQVIKAGSKIFKKAPTSKVTNALANYTTGTFKTGSHTFQLTKSDMTHMLTRHHPKYWTGQVKQSQTFYDSKLSVNDVKNIALEIAKQNNTTLAKQGTNATFQVKGKVDGVEYVLGITKGHIRQLYPTK
ncbi:hypothetical protein [Metabacillus fastidiosus]|uniref:hypothetical protein n=1 Tax=Metabacillus fastidiosus TaxID=1458 RepID=UPI002DBACBB0|nr:hypothetical protein [Metabacillus fastidiosus]MEC2078459.1 hypothetical protein [Metabacillus fastidiosus]